MGRQTRKWSSKMPTFVSLRIAAVEATQLTQCCRAFTLALARLSCTLYCRHNSAGVCIFQVTVKVQDNGSPPLSTNCFLNVAVDDENDNSPSFDYSNEFYQTNMLRSVATNSRVYRVYATDADAGDNRRIAYSMSATTPSCSRCFQIEPDSGWIKKGVGALHASTEVCQ